MQEQVSYRPIIDNFEWSYSRLSCFCSCKYQFYLKYIKKIESETMFFSSYGSFMHSLLEDFYKGNLTREEMKEKFIVEYRSRVKGDTPKRLKRDTYIQKGLNYIETFEPFPFETLAVESRIHFEVGGYPIQGVIDYIGKKDGKIYIVDHKSRDLKPRSKREKPTLNDKLLDDMLTQLYVYAHGLKQEYGFLPDYLCFNCFKNGNFIVEPFNEEKYYQALDWVVNTIHEIEDFADYFDEGEYEYNQCNFLCDVHRRCDVYTESREGF